MDDEGFVGPVEEVRFGCVNGIVRQIGSDEFFIGKWGVWRVVKVGLEDALVTLLMERMSFFVIGYSCFKVSKYDFASGQSPSLKYNKAKAKR